jgi:aldose 1-epimerase
VTNHSYFNLSGDLKRDILDHELTLKSESFLELDKELIPTGEIVSVKGTPFDFRECRNIKDGSESEHVQNRLAGKGYDHPFLLADNLNQEIVLKDSESGRVLTIETDQPAVVLYTGTQLSSDFKIQGAESRKYLGLCLETQGLPDSIHHPHFPSSILDKDEVFHSTTKYMFSVLHENKDV